MNCAVFTVCSIVLNVLAITAARKEDPCDGHPDVIKFCLNRFKYIKLTLNVTKMSSRETYEIRDTVVYKTDIMKRNRPEITHKITQEITQIKVTNVSSYVMNMTYIDTDTLTSITIEIIKNDKCKNITITATDCKAKTEHDRKLYEGTFHCLKSSRCKVVLEEDTGAGNNESQDSAEPPTNANTGQKFSNNNSFSTSTTTSENENTENTAIINTATATDCPEKQSQTLIPSVLPYAIPVVLVICFLIVLVIYICVKKRCHRNSVPAESMELNTYTTADQVLYADLGFVQGDSQPPTRNEESPYAQIVGVLKPAHNNVKK